MKRVFETAECEAVRTKEFHIFHSHEEYQVLETRTKKNFKLEQNIFQTFTPFLPESSVCRSHQV